MAAPPNVTGRGLGKDGNWYYHDAKRRALAIPPDPTVSQPSSDIDHKGIQEVDPTVSQPSPTASSAVDPTVSQPLHDGNSAVTPNGTSAVRPNGISTVDERLRYRRSTIPQVTLEPFRRDLEPSGEIVGRFDFADTSAASCAAAPLAALTGKSDAVVTSTSKSKSKAEQPQSVPVVNEPLVKQPMVNKPWVGGVRPKGVVTKLPPPMPPSPPKPTERPVGRQTKGERPLPPNWKCYPTVFVVGKNIDEHGNWLGGRLPRCHRCKGLLPPQENHVCSGYMPHMGGLQPMSMDERRALRTAALLNDGDWDDDQYDPTTPANIPLVVKYGEDVDEDEPNNAEITSEDIDPEYRYENEGDGVILEGWDEDRWLEWKRQQLGYSKDYDPTLDSQGEELDWEHEEYEDEDS